MLWAIYAVLPETRLARQNVVLQTLGYGRFQRLCWLVIPEIAPALGATMLAVLAGPSLLWMSPSSRGRESAYRRYWHGSG